MDHVGYRSQSKYRDIQCCHLRARPHSKLPTPVVCGCCVGVVGTCTSWGAELVRTRGHGGGSLGEDNEGDDDEETLLGDSIEGGEGGRGLACG
jgi:hypothetical protein